MGFWNNLFGTKPTPAQPREHQDSGGAGVPADLNKALQEAFTLGEAKDLPNRERAVRLYQAIVRDHPDCSLGWFNLGVIQSRIGQREAAIASLSHVQESTSPHIVAAYAKAKLIGESGRPVSDAELPERFRGNKWVELSVQGSVHNAANALRNQGYECVVGLEPPAKYTITSKVGSATYTIAVIEFGGQMFKDVFRQVGGGQRINLGDVKQRDRSTWNQADWAFKSLDVAVLDLVQAPVAGATTGNP
jgi:hypothetical protein